MLVITSLVAIFAYQAWWLVSLYHSQKSDMERKINEAMGISDYGELTFSYAYDASDYYEYRLRTGPLSAVVLRQMTGILATSLFIIAVLAVAFWYLILIIRRQNGNKVVNTRDILLELWGDDSFFNTRSLHVFMTKLRHKLARDGRIRIVNVRGIGYKLLMP